MKGQVVIRCTLDCTDEADAVDAVLNCLGRAAGKCRSQKSVRDWLREYADIQFIPDSTAGSAEKEAGLL